MNRLPSQPPALSGFSYVRPLGTGGFADVFLYEQNLPRRSVAVKVLLQSVVDADVVRMFSVEADVMARLSAHPSILTVHSAGVSADGRPYLVMELCPQSPASRFRSAPLELAAVLDIGVRMASALETAHRAGVLHRDVKPSNILSTTYGAPVLSDFGIAASVARAGDDDVFAMSVPWSAPEVVDESSTGTVASEVFSLGATLYSLLAGRSPFEPADGGRITTEQLRVRIRRAHYAPVGTPGCPASLDALLARMMRVRPEHRPSMIECAEELQRIQAEVGVPRTAIEVAVDEWAVPVDFEDTGSRVPVASTVPVHSARPRARSGHAGRPAAPRTATPEAASARRPGARLWVAAGGALLVGAGLAAGFMALVR